MFAYCVGSLRHILAIQHASRPIGEGQLHINMNSKYFGMTYKKKGGVADTVIDTYRSICFISCSCYSASVKG
jgi:hypothetical protein